MSKFVHLHVHSHYSLLNALPQIGDLVKLAKKYGMNALALTDAGNLYGAIEFFKACQKEEIKPIVGVDAFVAARTRFDKEGRLDSKSTRLILLAKDLTGYKNLLKLVTDSHMEGFYYKPRIDREVIQKYKEGLIAISPSFSGEITQSLKNGSEEDALEQLDFYKKEFGDDFYLEVTHHPEIDRHEELQEKIIAFARKTNTQIVAAHDVYYLHKEDKEARATLMSIQKVFEGRSFADDEGDFSFISQEEAEELFKDTPDALENTIKIAEKCNLEIPLGKWMFPEITLPDGKTADEVLREIVYAGFERRNMEQTPDVLKRVEYELEVIKTKGYSPYFLVVADLLKYARENGILSNIRGSVSGSIVTYLSGITNIDPLYYEIPFERFLNPDRPSAPDIDMDYADDRRDDMVSYARRKYGNDKVALIGTFGTMAARGAVKDTARAMGHPYAMGDRISKLIPMGSQGFPMTIERALEESPELKEAYENEGDVKEIIDMAMKIEGCARHISVHAAGVVIAPVPLTDIVPLQFDPKGEGKIITQYDMYSVDENAAGLLKFDFLGLKNLKIIADTLRLIKKLEGVELHPDTIDIEDKKTFEMLARGETVDLFQLNGAGMTKYLKELRPTTIHDINSMVALYRPGPIQFIPEYIARKHNPRRITYLDPALEPILNKTYGILVYQDDLLMMANQLAGYTWGEVDKFRKAVGKKIPEEMAKQKEKFIQGCVDHQKWPLKKAQQLWTWIEPFASYGFNKAHSVSYGRVAYITAYLKANYPGEYMRAVLNSEAGEVEKVAESIAECKRIGIEVLPPDVNESYEEFTLIKTPEKQTIRFGLNTIKGFGEGISHAIVEERKKNGKFASLEDFLNRIKDRNLNKKSMEALVKVGGMDNIDERGRLLANLDSLLQYNKEATRGPVNQNSLFGADTVSLPPLRLEQAPAATMKERLGWEKELLGLYLTGHPLEEYRDKLVNRPTLNKIKTMRSGMEVVVFGLVEVVKEILTKKGDKMCFIKLVDFTGSLEVVVFPKTCKKFEAFIVPDKCIAIKGKLSKKEGADEVSLLADAIKAL